MKKHTPKNVNVKSAAQTPNLSAALLAVKAEVRRVGEQLRDAEPEHKEELQAQMTELMSSMGMTYDPSSPIEDFLSKEEAPASEEAEPVSASANTPSWWERFKAFLSNNKKMVIGAVVVTIAGAAALYAFLRGQSSTTVNLELPPASASGFHNLGTSGDDATFMSKIGAFFVAMYDGAVKGLVAAKDWVVGLFSKSSTAAADVAEVTAELSDAVAA